MNLSIGFIGAGNIAEAMISGLKKVRSDIGIRVTNQTNFERLEHLAGAYQVVASRLEELVPESQVIVIAVKPKNVKDVLKQLQSYDLGGKLIISVAAGVGMRLYNRYLPEVAVIRAMPNTSTAVLHSMTGLVRGEYVTQEQAGIGETIFAAVGKVLWIPEEKMNALTAISGSGPAYFYLFIESLILAGVELGLTEEEAETLVLETSIGAGKMIAESNKAPGVLRREVTSPNGTTYEAINVFMQENLTGIVVKAARACARRSQEMEGEYSE